MAEMTNITKDVARKLVAVAVEKQHIYKMTSNNVVHFPKKEKMKYITLKPSDALLFNEHVKAKAKKV